VQRVVVAGLLHDIGLIGVPDAVLARPIASLDAGLQALHHRHAVLGEQSLLALDDLQPVAALIRSHHERHDGQGFPDGLAGEGIELGARILAVADSYDELLSGAFGMPCMPAPAVRNVMLRGRGTRFDPAVIDALMRVTRPQADAREPVPVTAVGWARIEAGMELGADLRSREGVLLLSSDHVLSADMIERVHTYARREDTGLKLQIRARS
jgi:response regulator RpfG family c-di-GMP phosphodiesterase